MFHKLTRPPAIDGNNRQTRSHRLEQDNAKGLGVRGIDDDVHVVKVRAGIVNLPDHRDLVLQPEFSYERRQ
jgi:hypothetical protein